MPQMAPLPWMTLLITAVMFVALVMTMIYFIIQPVTLKNKVSTPRLSVNDWAW
nr:ATP synthase F0 subunit 8 [Drepanosurus uchidai]BCW86868.1 ATP synthase F0 subunit 8 [Drepanosurus uchidai]